MAFIGCIPCRHANTRSKINAASRQVVAGVFAKISNWFKQFDRTTLGMFCMCGGVCIFSVNDMMVKVLSTSYPIAQTMVVRSVVVLSILIVACAKTATLVPSIAASRSPYVIIRSVAGFASHMCYYLALASLPLAEAATLFFSAPLFISVMAALVLREKLSVTLIAALMMGFVGIVVTLRPNSAAFDWASILVVLAALLYAMSQVITRWLGAKVPTLAIPMAGNAVFLIGAPFVGLLFRTTGLEGEGDATLEFLLRPWKEPDLAAASLMAACGVAATIGTILLTCAYRLASASKVAVLEFTAMLWAPVWGLIFFMEWPASTTWLGAALICGAGLLVLRANRRTRVHR